MFVASSLYNYATGSGSVTANGKADGPSPTNTRVKRHPIRKRGGGAGVGGGLDVPTSPPPSYASVAAGQTNAEGVASIHDQLAHEQAAAAKRQRTAAELTKIAVIDSIVKEEDLYKVLAVKRNAKPDEIRRGFLNRSRVCHPDKFPSYTPCVLAFQKVSFAYQTLSKPSSRRMYDVSGRTDLAAALNNDGGPGGPNGGAATDLGSDETLNGVLYSVFCEIFLDGDLEMIRVLINALNESNPGLNLGDDAINSIEDAFAKLREIMLAGKKYLSIVRFELIRLYEIQHSLRQLSYFDVFGRLRLTLQLARVTLSIPMAIDQAMKEPEEVGQGGDGEDLLNEKTAGGAFDGGDLDDDNGSGSSDGSGDHSSDEDERPQEDEFGMRAEDPESDNEGHGDGGGGGGIGRREKPKKTGQRLHRRASRRARVEEAAKKARIKEQEEKALQRKGLLGPTAAGLLNGVVKVLETSEAWVPGSRKDSSDD